MIGGCDVILLPKVQAEYLAECLWADHLGLTARLQGTALTQVAIDRWLTLIAFEAMNHWQADGGFGLHVFQKNSELAGYLLRSARNATGGHHGQLWPPAFAPP